MKTFDGVEVEQGSKVWVIGSIGIHETRVIEPVTSYHLHGGQIPVSQSFSTKEAAKEAAEAYYKKREYRVKYEKLAKN